MRAGRMRGGFRRALAATAALVAGTAGLAIGAAQPVRAAPPNMIYHPQGSPPYNFPFGYSGPFGQVIFDRTLAGGTVTFFADGVALPECTFSVDASTSYSCWLRRQLDPGSYDIRVDYSGFGADDPTSTVGTPITVHAVRTELSDAVVTTPDPGATTEVRATLRRDETGATGPVAGVTLHFSVAGGGSCDGLTDSAGTAACQLVLPTTSTSLTIRFDGDARHLDTELTVPVALVAATTTTLVLNPSPTPWDTGVTATATISPAPTGGTVVFSIPAGARCINVTPIGSTASCTFLAPLGTTPVTATYSGSASHAGSTGSATLIGQPRPTTLTITSHDPLTVGEPADVNARLFDTLANVGAPAGLAVTITLGTASCPATTGANGVASCQITPTAVAPTALVASFAGNAQYAADSGSRSVTVAKAQTVATLSSSPAQFQAPLTITATVANADGGTIDFRTAGTSIGGCDARPVTLSAGSWTAACTTTTFPVGTFPVIGIYSGTANTDASTSPPHNVVITPAGTTLTYTGDTTATVDAEPTGRAVLRSTATNDVIPGQPVSFTWAAGSCSATTDLDGVATCRLHAPHDAGTQTLTVRYAEAADESFLGSSTTATIAVARAATTTTLQVPTDAVYGELTQLIAVVSPPGITGTVAFTVDGGLIGGCADAPLTITVLGYQATCNTPNLPAGARMISATFSGNTDYEPSTAPAQPLTVWPGPTALTYTGDTTGTVGMPVTMRATLTRDGNPPATGPLVGRSVTFTGAGGTCTATTGTDGVATCTITPDEVADGGVITAAFAATSEYAGAATDATLTVGRATPGTVLDSPPSAEFGEAVTLIATVTPNVASGTVSFFYLQVVGVITPIAGCTDVPLALDGGDLRAACTTTSLPADTTDVTAVYSGDADYLQHAHSNRIRIDPAPTELTYTGAQAGSVASPLTFEATLVALPEGGTPVAGATIDFVRGDLACRAVTDETGTARCAVTPTAIAQSGPVQVTFAATAEYQGAAAEVTIELVPTSTTTTLAAPTTAGFSLPVELVARIEPFALDGTVRFLDGGAAIAGCEAIPVADDGTARCSTTASALGSHQLTAEFTGNDSYVSSASPAVAMTVVDAATDLTYLGPSSATVGAAVTVSAALHAEDPSPGPSAGASALQRVLATASGPDVAGQSIVFTLGDVSCTAVTGTDGVATCAITPVTAATGATLVVSFTGAPGYSPSRTEVTFAVAAAPVPPPDPTVPDPGNPTLPATGSNATTVILLGLALVAAGLTGLRLRRRPA